MENKEFLHCVSGEEELVKYCFQELQDLQKNLKHNTIERAEILDKIDDTQKWLTAIFKGEM